MALSAIRFLGLELAHLKMVNPRADRMEVGLVERATARADA